MSKTTLALKIIISTLCALIAVFPFSEILTSSTEEDVLVWQKVYIHSEPQVLVIYILFLIFWIVTIVSKINKFKHLINIVLTILAFAFFVLGIGNIFLPLQDYSPSYGLIMSILLFPMMLSVFIFNKTAENTNS